MARSSLKDVSGLPGHLQPLPFLVFCRTALACRCYLSCSCCFLCPMQYFQEWSPTWAVLGGFMLAASMLLVVSQGAETALL